MLFKNVIHISYNRLRINSFVHNSQELDTLEEKIDTYVFITETQKKLKHHLAITYLYPSCLDCIKNLILHPELLHKSL